MPGGALRRVGVIAWTETRRHVGGIDRRTGSALLLLGLVTAALVPVLLDRGIDFDRGIYRAAVPDDHPLAPAVDNARVFVRVRTTDPMGALARGDADLAASGNQLFFAPGEKGMSALAALRDAAKDLTFYRMLSEEDAAAAFPVRVEVIYEEQEASFEGVPRLASPAPASGAIQPRSGATGAATTAGGDRADSAPVSGPSTGFAFLPQDRQVSTPGSLAPPFPFRSLLLAYLFLLPMNFVVQVYAGSAIAERLDRKGEALLASPARPWEIIVGKALPYFLAMMGIGALIALAIGAGWVSIVALVPLALAFLAFEFAAAMFARSFRELTFLTVFASVALTIYAFLPAVFSDVHPVALISPITLVVLDLKGAAVSTGALLYATVPLGLVSAVLFLLASALYTEEDLFHQKRVHEKALDAVARQVRGPWSAFRLSLLFIPFVFAAELLLVTFLFAWPFGVGLVGTLVAVALVEEAFKAVPSYAHLRRATRPHPARYAIVFGGLAGIGFFAAEKGFLLAGLVGLFELPAGAAVFGATTGIALAPAWWPLLLLGPFALHAFTAALSAWGASLGRRHFLLAFGAAVLLHVAYNYTVVRTLIGGEAH